MSQSLAKRLFGAGPRAEYFFVFRYGPKGERFLKLFEESPVMREGTCEGFASTFCGTVEGLVAEEFPAELLGMSLSREQMAARLGLGS